MRIERVVKRGGKPVIVTSQPQVKGPPVNPRQIIDKMDEAGFRSIAPGAFHNLDEGVLAFDLYPKNVKFSGGVATPIDPVLQRVTSEFVDFIQKNYRQLPDFQNAEALAWEAEMSKPGRLDDDSPTPSNWSATGDCAASAAS